MSGKMSGKGGVLALTQRRGGAEAAEMVRLGEVCCVIAGNSAPQDERYFESGCYPFVRTSDVGAIHFGVVKDTRDKLNAHAIAKMRLFRKGSVLFPKSGASTFLNHRVLLGIDAYVSSHLAVITPFEEHIDSKYLLHSLVPVDTQVIFPNTDYPSLKASDIADLEIPLPPLPEQKRIAATLDRICELKKNAEVRLAKLDLLVKSRFVEMFGDPTINAKLWPTFKLDERCSITTGNTPSRYDETNYGEFIEWVKSDNLVDGRVTHATELLSEKGYAISRHVNAGSLLMTCIAGSINSIGNCSIVDREVAFNQQLNALTPRIDNPLYLLWMFKLSRPILLKGFNLCLKGILSKSHLAAKVFPFPPLALQREFAAFVEKVEKLKESARRSAERLDVLYRAKLQEHFG